MKMKLSVSLLAFSLCVSLCGAEIKDEDGCFQTFILTRLKELEAKLQETEKNLEDVKGQNQETAKQLEDLKTQNQGNQVAFGATLGNVGNFGPFNTHITLVYENVYVNTGAYNNATGIFTAPVKGVYYFSYSGHQHSTKLMGLQLMKNGHHMITVFNYPSGNRYETATNGITLILEVGDQVYMRLWHNSWIFDGGSHHSTFTGFLVFPL